MRVSPLLSDFRPKIFCPAKTGPKMAVFAKMGVKISIFIFKTQKAHPCMGPRLLTYFA